MNRLWIFAIFVNARFRLDTDVHVMCAVDICDRHIYVLKGILTSDCYCFLKVMFIGLSILLGCLTLWKGYVDKSYLD